MSTKYLTKLKQNFNYILIQSEIRKISVARQFTIVIKKTKLTLIILHNKNNIFHILLLDE